jgi:hypothetical protein
MNKDSICSKTHMVNQMDRPKQGTIHVDELYEKWHERRDGFTRKTMNKVAYRRMMARLNSAGKRRTNHAVTTKLGLGEFKRGKKHYMAGWRKRLFEEAKVIE